jgi:hypothetical protein
MKMKRREILASSLAVAAAAAQTPPAGKADLVAQARQSMKAGRAALAKVKLPQATEPAFVFKA